MDTERTDLPLRQTPPARALRWAADALGAGSRVVAVRALHEGGWHANHAIDVIDRPGRRYRLVLRRWARPEWIVEDPDLSVERELTALRLLADSPVAAPAVVAADPDGAACDVPALLLTRLPGTPPGRPRDMRSFLTQLAAVLPAIHAANGRARELLPRFRTYVDLRKVEPPSWLARSPVWKRALEIAGGPPPPTATCFIHRDYHPGNTLWRRGQLSGVVDWTQASWGPASIDLGWMRWNLAYDHSQGAADWFLGIHRDLSGNATDHHPYWDILTVVDFATATATPPPPDERRRRLEQHVAAALAQLSGR